MCAQTRGAAVWKRKTGNNATPSGPHEKSQNRRITKIAPRSQIPNPNPPKSNIQNPKQQLTADDFLVFGFWVSGFGCWTFFFCFGDFNTSTLQHSTHAVTQSHSRSLPPVLYSTSPNSMSADQGVTRREHGGVCVCVFACVCVSRRDKTTLACLRACCLLPTAARLPDRLDTTPHTFIHSFIHSFLNHPQSVSQSTHGQSVTHSQSVSQSTNRKSTGSHNRATFTE